MAQARTYLLALVEGRTPLQGRWSHLLDVEVESVSPTPVFQSVSEEIKWLQLDADLGCVKAQHRLGLLYLQSRRILVASVRMALRRPSCSAGLCLERLQSKSSAPTRPGNDLAIHQYAEPVLDCLLGIVRGRVSGLFDLYRADKNGRRRLFQAVAKALIR